MAYDQELAQRIRATLGDAPGLVEKKMFGGVGFLVNGNMACGVHGERMIVRLPEGEYEEALAQPHVHVFDMTGRPMKGWIMVSSGGYATERALQGWIDLALEYARSLPPK